MSSIIGNIKAVPDGPGTPKLRLHRRIPIAGGHGTRHPSLFLTEIILLYIPGCHFLKEASEGQGRPVSGDAKKSPKGV